MTDPSAKNTEKLSKLDNMENGSRGVLIGPPRIARIRAREILREVDHPIFAEVRYVYRRAVRAARFSFAVLWLKFHRLKFHPMVSKILANNLTP